MPGAGVVVEVASGGTAANIILTSGATLEVLSGGLADPTIVSSGTTTVSAGGTDNGAQISGGTQLVYGVANAAIVFAGAEIVEFGRARQRHHGFKRRHARRARRRYCHCAAYCGRRHADPRRHAFRVHRQQQEFPGESGATSINNTVLSGGTLELVDGAVQSGTRISAGGILEIGSSQALSGFAVSSGVLLDVLVGGTASSTTVSGGGKLFVDRAAPPWPQLSTAAASRWCPAAAPSPARP